MIFLVCMQSPSFALQQDRQLSGIWFLDMQCHCILEACPIPCGMRKWWIKAQSFVPFEEGHLIHSVHHAVELHAGAWQSSG